MFLRELLPPTPPLLAPPKKEQYNQHASCGTPIFFEGSFNPKIAFGFPFLSGTYRILRVIELFTDAAKPFGRISMRHQYSDTYIINMHLLTWISIRWLYLALSKSTIGTPPPPPPPPAPEKSYSLGLLRGSCTPSFSTLGSTSCTFQSSKVEATTAKYRARQYNLISSGI